MKIKTYSLYLCLIFSGCSHVAGDDVRHAALLGDRLTTAYGLGLGNGIVEGNPVFSGLAKHSGVGAGLLGTGLTYGVQHAARQYGTAEDCETAYNATTAAKVGAVGNNLAILAGVGEPTAIAVVAGLAAWNGLKQSGSASKFCQATPGQHLNVTAKYRVTAGNEVEPVATKEATIASSNTRAAGGHQAKPL